MFNSFAMDEERIAATDPTFAFRGARTCADRPGGSGASLPDQRSRAGVSAPASSGASLAGWIEELQEIGRHIPAFAVWQVATLEQCFHRYCNILQLVSRDVRFRLNCLGLMANAERISEKIELSRRSPSLWPPFNHAAFELRQDCELLAELLAGAGQRLLDAEALILA